jgi:hypothetical protein
MPVGNVLWHFAFYTGSLPELTKGILEQGVARKTSYCGRMAFVPAVRKFYTSAIVSLPAKRHVERIQKVRLPHDKSAPRWMPHIPMYACSEAQ